MEEGLKSIPLARFLWLGMDSGKETNMITEMQQLLLKNHPQFHIQAEQTRRCLSVTCSIQSLSCCQNSPASSCTASIITGCYFWLLSTSHPSHASPGTKDTNSSSPSSSSSPLPSARCRCRLRPPAQGAPEAFPCSFSVSGQEAFHPKLHVGGFMLASRVHVPNMSSLTSWS